MVGKYTNHVPPAPDLNGTPELSGVAACCEQINEGLNNPPWEIALKHNHQMANTAEKEENERLNARIGPVFMRGLVKKIIDITDVELTRRVTAHHLPAPVTTDGVQVFPAFQFDIEQKQNLGVLSTAA